MGKISWNLLTSGMLTGVPSFCIRGNDREILGEATYQESGRFNNRKVADWFEAMLGFLWTFRNEEDGSVDIEVFRQMVAKKPDGFLGRYGLGDKILQSGENFEEAAEHLRVAVQLDPVHVASHFALGRALANLKQNDEAKKVLNAGIEAALSGRSNGGGDLVPEMRQFLQTLE